jgi:hypothetical protein
MGDYMTDLEKWVAEGDALIREMQAASLTFALGFAFGKWWASRPNARSQRNETDK